jgi:hypothetical protein
MQDSNGIMQCAPQLNSQTPGMKRNIASPSTATEGLREIRSPWSQPTWAGKDPSLCFLNL